MTAELRIELLGPVRAWRGTDELALGSAHRRAVLAILATYANRAVSRQELIDAVWGETPPTSAEGSIYTYVSGIRYALEPGRPRRCAEELLTSVSAGYCLRIPAEACDVHRFQEHRDRAQRCWAARDAAGAIEALDSALRLWKGEALSGVPGPFATNQRARLAELHLATLERRAELMLAAGGHAEIVAELSILAREHPLREGLRELLILALYRCGRQADALAVFHETRRTLIEELGTEPRPKLRDLHEQILASAPGLAKTDVQVAVPKPTPPKVAWAGSPQPVRPANFVGRADEVAFLRTAVSEVAAGNGQSVWLEGVAGIGKSWLLAEGLAEATASGCQLAWGVCDELDQPFTLHALLGCLGIEADSADPRRAALAYELGGGSGVSVPADCLSEAVHRLLGLVSELCADAPLILVLDDLQWADETSLLVWQRLCQVSRQLPLLLIGACRPISSRRGLQRLRAYAEAECEALALAPLPDSEVGDLLRKIVGLPVNAELRNLVHSAGGNPLYVREIVNGLLRTGSIVFTDDKAGTDPSLRGEVPDVVLSAIGSQLAFLSGPTADFLRWAALLGERFSLTDVATALGKPASELSEMIDEACATGQLKESGEMLAFRYPVVHQAFYGRIPKAVRLALHRQLATALAQAGAPAERIAGQLIAAPEPVDSWVVDWLLANVAVLASNAPRTATALLRSALNRVSMSGRAREELAATFARLLFSLGRVPANTAQYVLSRTTDSLLAAEARLILAYSYYRKDQLGAALSTLRPAMRDERVADSWKRRIQPLLATLDPTDPAVVPKPRVAHDSLDLPDTYSAVPELGDLWLLALQDTTLALQSLDHLSDPLAALRGAEHFATSHTLPGEVALAGAVHYYWLGMWDDALARITAVTECAPETESYLLARPGASTIVHGVAALVAAHRDDQETALGHLHCAGQWSRTEFQPGIDFVLATRSLLAEQQDRLPEALAWLTPVIGSDFAPMVHRYRWLPRVVRLATHLGKSDQARAALRVCESDCIRTPSPSREAAVAHCRGLVTRDPGEVVAAADHYRCIGRRIERAAADEDAAALLTERGLVEEARAALMSALSAFTDVRAFWNVQRVESRIRELGNHRIAAAPAPHQTSSPPQY
ncbi:BTAD domain-containing putative transcriptional regulator [Saccharopolyspora spinosa]|uniref:ATPase n=1 Tax=Saccharopolyspora spinosa TaxID=60894 RepID=A0A2N3Y4Y6_SACSN|nr:BTAD domain-containing putative transcriptional regulator [Saccharopolyspora spinosa]PKW17999.1 putative ATPase [Saccharopolyspora spinosa]